MTAAHEPPQTPVRCLRVALAATTADLVDDLPPDPARTEPITSGMRVLVPFGRGRRVGIVTAVSAESTLAKDKLRRIEAVIDRTPLLGEPDLRFLLWAAGYYHCSVAGALFSAVPARLRRPEPLLDGSMPGWRITSASAAPAPEQLRRAPRQLEALRALQESPSGIDDAALRIRFGASD